MRNQGIGSWPARRARKTPHRTALVLEDHGGREGHGGDEGHGSREGSAASPGSSDPARARTSYTYAQLHERTTRLAQALRATGVRRGDRVAYLGPNHPSFLETLFAAGLLGAVFVPLNTRLAAAEIGHQLADSGTRLLVHAPAHAPTVQQAQNPQNPQNPERVQHVRHAHHLHTVQTGEPYERLLAQAPATPLDEDVAGDDLCLIMYTSGTTGRSKGAMLTHANLTWNSVNVLVDTEFAADERALVTAPLFHTAGLGMLALPVLLKGGTCVLVGSFDPGRTLDLIEEHRITTMFGVPTMYEQIVAAPRWASADLSSLRNLLCGGSPVPVPLIETYQRRGLVFQQGYGMTEASPGVLFLDAEHAVAKTGTAGVPHFFTSVRVVRPDLTDAAVDEPGEVLVRGPHVMPGYWGLPEASGAALPDGWLRTGDIARVDADGYVTIVDRLKDMIISGGENIYPAEVEEALAAHPAVAECAVIGVPDPAWGEAPRAVVVPRDPAAPPSLDDLRAFLAGRLAPYKAPRSLALAAELPRTASGKLRKPLLRERYGTDAGTDAGAGAGAGTGAAGAAVSPSPVPPTPRSTHS